MRTKRGTRTTAAVTALVLGASLVAPVSGLAAGPPRGHYICSQYDPISGYLPSGGFKLVTATKYTADTGGGGTYAVKGKKVTFKKGPYKDFTGKTRRDKHGGNWIIDLTLKSDHNVVENCSHAKS
jgi:hypothetical protein